MNPATSSEGLLRGSGSDGSRELADDAHPPWINGTEAHRNLNLFGGMEPRVIGGNKVPARRYPYTVAFIDEGGFFCGGVLISYDMVLTAAHCYKESRRYLEIFVGSDYLSDRASSSYGRGQSILPDKGWINPSFDEWTMNNDFMLYRLDELATEDVELVELNSNPRLPAKKGDRLFVMGWGDIDPNPFFKISDVLREVGVGYIPNNECMSRTGYVDNQYVGFESSITDAMICALDNGKDGCQGDSGGPIITKGSDSRGRKDILVGLSSWGVACAHQTLPGVYARISSQYKWIKSIVCDNSCNPAPSFKCGGGSGSRCSGSSGGGGGGGSGGVGGGSGNTIDKATTSKDDPPKNKPGKKGKGKAKAKGGKMKRRKKKKKKKKKKPTKFKGQRVRHRHELFS